MPDFLPIDQRAFSLGEACELAGVSPRRVTVWYQRELISYGERVGPKKRLLSIWEIFQLAITWRLSVMAPVDVAAAWSAEAARSFREQRNLEVGTADELRAELGRGDEVLALFVYDRPHVVGVKRTFDALAQEASEASGKAREPTFFFGISQVFYSIVTRSPLVIGTETEVAGHWPIVREGPGS